MKTSHPPPPLAIGLVVWRTYVVILPPMCPSVSTASAQRHFGLNTSESQQLFAVTVDVTLAVRWLHTLSSPCLAPSVRRHVFLFILVTIGKFYTASETHVGMKTVQTLAINLLTAIHLS